MSRPIVCLVALMLSSMSAAGADKVTKQVLESGGRTHTYYLYAPDGPGQASAVPLLILLHGSGRNGLSQIDPWKGLAKKEGILLVALDSINPSGWNLGRDSPDVIYDLVQVVSALRAVDSRRVYLFGHSAGAIYGLRLAVLESAYFAAVAVHAGALPPDTQPYLDRAPRKIPLALWVGTNDAFFPLPVVRATRDTLASKDFPVILTEMKGHTHDYYGRSATSIGTCGRFSNSTSSKPTPSLLGISSRSERFALADLDWPDFRGRSRIDS